MTLVKEDVQSSEAHQVILTMANTNYGELRQQFETFTRVWEAGGQTSLHLFTKDGQAKAMLEIQLGPPAAPRPGAPDLREEGPGLHHHKELTSALDDGGLPLELVTLLVAQPG